MSLALKLESFDLNGDTVASPPLVEEKPLGYEAGYADGLAAAEAAYQQEQTALRADLIQAVSESTMTYADAQRGLLDAIGPLHDALLDTLLPATLAPALHAHLREIITVARQMDLSGPITLSVPPDQEEAIAAALTDIDPASLAIRTDPALSANAVWVLSGTTETALDLDAALAAITATMDDLRTLTDTQQEVEEHG